MAPHMKTIRENEELNCLEFDLTQGQVGLISKESRWVLDKFNFSAHWSKGKKDYYVEYNDDDYKKKRLHQLLMNFPSYPKFHVDHVNGNTRDNRVENLRIVTPRQNTRNTIVKNPLGMHNVHYCKKEDYYRARIYDNEGKQKSFSLSCKTHGKERALELVKGWRKQKEKEFGEYL
jgi:hypothetical protein